MNTNSPITIRRVSNGFIVEPVRDSDMPVPIAMSDIAVFQTQAALADWLADHFEPLPAYGPLPPYPRVPGVSETARP